jgi:hypothetical protein
LAYPFGSFVFILIVSIALFFVKKERIVEKTRCRALCSMKDFVSLRVIYADVRGWATAHYGADVENK